MQYWWAPVKMYEQNYYREIIKNYTIFMETMNCHEHGMKCCWKAMNMYQICIEMMKVYEVLVKVTPRKLRGSNFIRTQTEHVSSEAIVSIFIFRGSFAEARLVRMQLPGLALSLSLSLSLFLSLSLYIHIQVDIYWIHKWIYIYIYIYVHIHFYRLRPLPPASKTRVT